jgi:hypothetical protein
MSDRQHLIILYTIYVLWGGILILIDQILIPIEQMLLWSLHTSLEIYRLNIALAKSHSCLDLNLRKQYESLAKIILKYWKIRAITASVLITATVIVSSVSQESLAFIISLVSIPLVLWYYIANIRGIFVVLAIQK